MFLFILVSEIPADVVKIRFPVYFVSYLQNAPPLITKYNTSGDTINVTSSFIRHIKITGCNSRMISVVNFFVFLRLLIFALLLPIRM